MPADELAAVALEAAPTVLEAFFWGWLVGDDEARRLYFEELITLHDLAGPGDEVHDA